MSFTIANKPSPRALAHHPYGSIILPTDTTIQIRAAQHITTVHRHYAKQC